MAGPRQRRPSVPFRGRKPTASERASRPTKPAARKATPAKPAVRQPAARKATPAKPAARKATPAKPAARKATPAKPAARKATPAKPAARKATPAKPAVRNANPAKPAVRRPAARRATPAKPAARKPAARKANPTKPAARKPAARKPAARQPAARKANPAKPAARKPAALQPAARRPNPARPAARDTRAGASAAPRSTATGSRSNCAARNRPPAPSTAQPSSPTAPSADRSAPRDDAPVVASGLGTARTAAPEAALTRRTRTGVIVRLAVSHRTMKPAPLAKVGTGPSLARTSALPAPSSLARAPLPAGVVRGRPLGVAAPEGSPRLPPAASGPVVAVSAKPPPSPTGGDLDRRLDEAARSAGLPELGRAGRRVAHALLEGRSVLALAPDSARLPAAVQSAGLIATAPFVIVSPRPESLRDQCDRLRLRRLPAVHLPAGTTANHSEALARIATGGPLLVFASPTALRDPAVQGSLRAARVAAISVEEAHALSEWSHELSPALCSLPQTIDELGPTALVAHVPVAVPVVARDVAERLRLRHALRIELPVLRPNVTLECVVSRGDSRHRALTALVSRLRRPGVVLCHTAVDVDAVYAALGALRVPVHRLHSGLSAAERSSELLAYSMPGRRAVLVATSAYSPLASPPLVSPPPISPPLWSDAEPAAQLEIGPGFEKRDLRFVIHHQAPSTLEQLAREIDLVGRDGEPANAVLLYDPEDLRRWERSLAEVRPRSGELVRLASELAALADGGRTTTLDSLALTAGVTRTQAGALAQLLAGAGWVGLANGWVQPMLPRAALVDRARRLADALETFFVQDPERRRAVHLLGEARGCRAAVLTRYFGGSGEARCGRCSICTGSSAALWGSEADSATPRRRPDARDFTVAPAGLAEADGPATREELTATLEERLGG